MLGDWSVVRGCRAAANTGDGISVEGMSVVVDNVSVHNEDGVTSAAGIVVGNSGGVSPGSTNPNANFTY